MALTHTTAAKNALVDAVVDLIDAGTTDAGGDLVLMTGADVEVATLNFPNPAFNAAAGGVASMVSIADDTSATGGTTTLFKIQNRDNTEVFRGTVGTGGTDVVLSSNVISGGDTVSITTMTYTSGN